MFVVTVEKYEVLSAFDGKFQPYKQETRNSVQGRADFKPREE
jgi:hypothetical protein